MATRAEGYRAEQQRANQLNNPKKKTSKRPESTKAATLGTAARNLKTSLSRLKGGPALEDSETGQPSRKSTRGSNGHIKAASNLQRRQVRRVHSPEARAARSAVR